jgi:DUF4097 and DUF4098 domain-containing protein YvlB
MKEEITRILKLVSEGKLSAEDATELIEALNNSEGANTQSEANADAAHAASQEATSEEGKGESKPKDPWKGFLDFVERIETDVTSSVDWKGIASQLKEGTQKGIDAIKKAAEEIRLGNVNFLFHTESREVTLPFVIDASKTLRIDNPVGTVTVKGGGTETKLYALAKIRGNSQEEAKSKAENFTMSLEESDHDVQFKQTRQSGVQVDIEVTLAANTNLDIRTSSGSVVVENSGGNVKILSHSGEVSVSGADGMVDVSVQSGDAMIKDSKVSMLTLECRSGDVSLVNIDGNVNARAASGDISVKNWKGKTLAVETVSGDVDASFGAPITGQATIRTVNGNASIEVPDMCDCRVSLSTIRGDVSVNIPLEDEAKTDQLVTGRLGAGTGSLEVSGINGDISLDLRSENVS